MSIAGEQERVQSNTVMIGVVAELDEANGLVRVDADGLKTDWLQWSFDRAGPGVRTWSAPEVGEQVVILCPYGDPSQAIVIGCVPQDDYPAPANLKTTHRTEYADGAFIEYDRDGHAYVLDVPTGGAITLHIGQTTLKLEDGQVTLTTPKVVVDSPDSTFTGNVKVDGTLGVDGQTSLAGVTSNGKNVGSDHKHSGVQTGGGNTGNPV
ncbi:MAG TPA: phage baseplate assembly protein V [Pyrinomonadaceae bacterium]|nr:phage baseplate assembly protein V [Pyrinomonadaceae bacterium]